jgi:steroid 5-alpha reductase family enzyme
MNLVLISIIAKFFLFLFCYLLILKFKKISVVDTFWGLSFLPEFIVAFCFKGFTHGNVILFGMVVFWSLRLSIYLGLRSKKIQEDSRYLEFSKNWPVDKFKSKVFTKIILIQFTISTLMSTCFYVYLFSPSFGWSAPFWNVPMLGLFLTGLFIEVLADEQMRRFKKTTTTESVSGTHTEADFVGKSFSFSNSKSQTYTGGLWKYVKYPNYLGEIMIWLSFGLLALPFKYGTLGLISPLAIFFFLTYVSGIPYLEDHRAKKEPYPNVRPKYKYIPYVF